MNIFIDERYDDEAGSTVLAIIKITDQQVNSIYAWIKKLILQKEHDRKTRSFLMTEFKAKNLIGKRYWPKILVKVFENIDCDWVVISCQPSNKREFINQYVQIINELLENNIGEIYADNINNKKFMKPIIDEISNCRFHFCDSRQNKGIQLADIAASSTAKKISKNNSL